MSLPTINKQWTTQQSGLQNLTLGSSTVPTPGDGQVLVKIHTVALNYRDTEVIMGLYNHHKTTGNETSSLVPCSDISGTIVSSKSSKWKSGDRVLAIFNQTHIRGQVTGKDMASGLGLPTEGCLQEYRVFDAEGLVKKPDYLTDEEASSREGETVLIQGTGGVAISGLQIAKASGMEVIITSSSDAKLAQAKALGADHTINYRTTPIWSEEVMKITQNEGVSNIFETGGALTLRQSFDAIAFGGLINAIGYLSGKEDDNADRTNTNVLALRRNVTLKGILNGPRERFEEMLKWYEEKKVRPVVDRVFGFEEAKEGLEYLFKGGHFGKVVVKVSE
ncbi:zinc-binding dehydrogenase [Botrytis cinerea]